MSNAASIQGTSERKIDVRRDGDMYDYITSYPAPAMVFGMSIQSVTTLFIIRQAGMSAQSIISLVGIWVCHGIFEKMQCSQHMSMLLYNGQEGDQNIFGWTNFPVRTDIFSEPRTIFSGTNFLVTGL